MCVMRLICGRIHDETCAVYGYISAGLVFRPQTGIGIFEYMRVNQVVMQRLYTYLWFTDVETYVNAIIIIYMKMYIGYYMYICQVLRI